MFDCYVKYLRHMGYQVFYLQNFSDVDDKINAAAKEQGVSIQELTGKITKFFYDDINALNVLSPTFEPRATEHISEMIVMIEQLIKNGHAKAMKNSK